VKIQIIATGDTGDDDFAFAYATIYKKGTRYDRNPAKFLLTEFIVEESFKPPRRETLLSPGENPQFPTFNTAEEAVASVLNRLRAINQTPQRLGDSLPSFPGTRLPPRRPGGV
jgi:hypothetical protein